MAETGVAILCWSLVADQAGLIPGVKTIKSSPNSALIALNSLGEATTPSKPANLALRANWITKSSIVFLFDNSSLKVSWLILVKTVTAKINGFLNPYF